MPGDPKACREHAKRCYQIAAEAHTPNAKKRFEDLARLWLKLAADLDAAQALLRAWGEPIEPPMLTEHPHRSFRKAAS
jgi:hypothetical protein